MQLMIRIMLPAAPPFLRHAGSPIPSEGLRSVTRAPAPLHHPPLLPTCVSSCRSIGDTLRSNDRRPAPPSSSVSSVTLLPCSRTPSPLRHFFNTPLRHLVHPLRRRTLAPPPLPFLPLHLKTEEWRDVSFTTKVETHPRRRRRRLPLLLCHGVNTNEEEMSPLLCPHLSLWPGDMHTHRCLSASLYAPASHLPCHHVRPDAIISFETSCRLH